MISDYGHGSIYQRKGDGLWIATAELPSNRDRGDAPRKRKKFGGKTPQAALAKLEAWRAENPAPESVASRGRQPNEGRARSLGTHTADEWRELVRSVDRKCEYCGVETAVIFKGPDGRPSFASPRKRVKDHRTPVAAGGSDAIDNIAVACHQCNTLKGLMDEPTFRAWMAAR